jgi:hypothetical protein
MEIFGPVARQLQVMGTTEENEGISPRRGSGICWSSERRIPISNYMVRTIYIAKEGNHLIFCENMEKKSNNQ